MAADAKDLESLSSEFKNTIEQFKEKNDKRLSAVEQEKGKLSEQVETLNIKLSEFEKAKKQLEDELLAIKRKGLGAAANDSQEAREHKEAFLKFIRKGDDAGLSELEQKAYRTTVGADGGFAVPTEWDKEILKMQRNLSPMRELCSQITVGSSDYKKLASTGAFGAGWVGEETARPETTVSQLAQLAATFGELYANPMATQTALDDMFYDVETDITDEIATTFTEMEGNSFLLGNGTLKPKGILAYTLATTADETRAFGTLEKVKSGTSAQFTADFIAALYYKLKPGYRKNASFMMSASTIFYARTLKLTTGEYIWRAGLDTGGIETLYGRPLVENEDMPAMGAASSSVLFGDFKKYRIVDRMGVRMLRDPYTNKPNVSFYTTKKVGGMLLDSRAFKVGTLEA